MSQRSIPACAGKPALRLESRQRYVAKVHPRVRGEASGRRESVASVYVAGSIPACAGKPFTSAAESLSHYRWGPSPRARGSRLRSPHRVLSAHDGSIPACAGKPARHRHDPSALRVHPRVRGEAHDPGAADAPVRGPSPRARGSLAAAAQHRRSFGSIPACAGKPSLRRRDTIRPLCGSIPACAGKPLSLI